MKNEAQEYAEAIAQEMRDLESVLSPAIAGDERRAKALAALEMDETEEDFFGLWINQVALDLSVRVDVRGSDYGISVIISRTLGGPRCDVEWDSLDGDWIEVRAWFGSDQGSAKLPAPSFVEEIRKIATVLK